LDESYAEELVRAFTLRQIPLPKSILTRDYNYRRPDLPIQGEAQVTEGGIGEILLYGDHLRTPDEATRIAGVRAEELRCRERRYLGQSQVPWLSPGYLFTLQEHPDAACNQEHLVIQTRHFGDQTQYLVAGLGAPLDAERAPFYRNEFTAIPASAQFRATRKTPKTRIAGVMHAHIDASGSGQYAELDDQGRYKVTLPFDIEDRPPGGASSWLRMAQPSAGAEHGMHFPLLKSTEVLLTFIEGDPDRPLIAAAVPNPETPSVVDNSAPTQCRITTAGQNKLHIEDAPGKERFLFQTPTQNTWMRIGAPNDPPNSDWDVEHTEEYREGFSFSSEGSVNGIVNENYSVKLGGNATELVLGGDELIVGGFYNWTSCGIEIYWNLGIVWEILAAINIELNPLHFKTDNVEAKEILAQIKVMDNNITAAESDIRLHKLRLDGNDSTLKAAESKINAIMSEVKATKNETTAATRLRAATATTLASIDQHVAAIDTETNVGISAIKTTKQKIDILERDVKSAGQDIYAAEQVINSGVKVDKTAGATILN
jgi:type VI secretion system secreted protein VgrG